MVDAGRFGPHAVLITAGPPERVHRLWRSLRARRPAAVEEVVAGAETVLVVCAPGHDPLSVCDDLIDLGAGTGTGTGAGPDQPVRQVEIPVLYGGADTEQVAEWAGVRPGDVAAIHSAADYTVAFLGFSPGFPYLSGGDRRLTIPRLATPRPSVPAGSVGLAAGMTAVYPQTTPGGWRLIGRTDSVLFDAGRATPALLEPGDMVRFRPVPTLPGGDPGSGAPIRGVPAPAPSGRAYVQVLDPGPLATVQDGGRIGWAHLGVPRSGAADRASARHANHLVGNHPDAAVIEATWAGPWLRLGDRRLVAVTGARAPVTVDGVPAHQDTALAVAAGREIRVGAFTAGLRLYIAIEGGVDVEPVLGSRSTDTLSGLGPRPLRSAVRLPLASRDHPPSGGRPERLAPPRLPSPGDVVVVPAVTGPRPDWITEAGMSTLASAEFTVSPASDRTGARLAGPPVGLARRGDLPSEGMVPGAVQVPPSGEPIILLCNHPTTGGYPVPLVLTDEGMAVVAQAPPGTRIRFSL